MVTIGDKWGNPYLCTFNLSLKVAMWDLCAKKIFVCNNWQLKMATFNNKEKKEKMAIKNGNENWHSKVAKKNGNKIRKFRKERRN